MATAPPPTRRASLLNGLRTGGVRTTSMNVPHTASLAGSFNVPRFSSNGQYSPFPEEDEMDQVGDLLSQNMQNMYINNNSYNARPMTAAVDGPNNRFAQQQQQQQYQAPQRPLNPNSVPFNPSFSNNTQPSVADVQAQVYQQQMQLMQLEIMRLEAAQAQAQRNQAAMMAEQLLRQQMNMGMNNTQANQNRRNSASFNPPATAGPLNTAFDLRNVANNAQPRRPSQADMLKLQLGLSSSPPPPSVYEDQAPMTAALGGRFGGRQPSAGFEFPRDEFEPFPLSSSPPRQTTVISGGTTIGNSNGSNNNGSSKSDAAVSWRRGNSPPNRTMSTSGTPSLRVTPPPNDPVSPPGLPSGRSRPRPLSFAAAAVPVHEIPVIVTIDTDEDASSTSSSQSHPTSPHSNSSLDASPLSPREEVSKKLYGSIGLGRAAPPSTHTINVPSMVNATLNQRLALSGQPVRQPRGPPSGADELGPKNFATRIRRKAIGGLGVLMGARERRGSLVEAQ